MKGEFVVLEKTKVLYIVPRCTKSGPIQVLQNIIKYLDKNYFELFLISIEPENNKRSMLDELKVDLKYQYVPVCKFQAVCGLTQKLRKTIEMINPDVIHTTGIIPDWIINRLFPEKQITIVHANFMVDYKYLCGRTVGFFLSRLHVAIIKKAHKAVACSKSLSDIYKQMGIDLPYVRNGVRCCIDEEMLVSRADLKLSEKKILFLYAASFNERKNHAFLCEIFSKNNSILNNCELILLGDGPTFDNLYQKYSKLNNINFVGRVPNVADYIYCCDYFVSSSIQEGMPMGVLEAMAKGMPVILSDIPQHKEIFDINSSVGVLFDLENEDSFLKKVQELLLMDRELLSIECKNTVKEQFDEKEMSRCYQAYYKEYSNRVV